MLRFKASRLLKDPIGVSRRWFKSRILREVGAVLERVKYRGFNGYDAAQYWQDRLSRYQFSLQGVGRKGLSEEENARMYRDAAKAFEKVCRDNGVDFRSVRVLDIGCGNGFYTKLLWDFGVKDYTGVDITDALFPKLRDTFPEFSFIRKDVSSQPLGGQFDLIIMIDVDEHIVSDIKFSFAMQNVRNCLGEGGVFIVTPCVENGKTSSWYVKTRPIGAYTVQFQGWVFSTPLPFRDKLIVSAKCRQMMGVSNDFTRP